MFQHVAKIRGLANEIGHEDYSQKKSQLYLIG